MVCLSLSIPWGGALKVHDLSPFADVLGFHVEEYAAGKGAIPPRRRRKKRVLYVATIEKVRSLAHGLFDSCILPYNCHSNIIQHSFQGGVLLVHVYSCLVEVAACLGGWMGPLSLYDVDDRICLSQANSLVNSLVADQRMEMVGLVVVDEVSRTASFRVPIILFVCFLSRFSFSFSSSCISLSSLPFCLV